MKRGLLLQDLFVGVSRGRCGEPICDWKRYTGRCSTTSIKFACGTNAPAPVKANSAVFLEMTTRTPLRMTQVEMKSDFSGNNGTDLLGMPVEDRCKFYTYPLPQHIWTKKKYGSSRWVNPSDGPSHIYLHLRQQGTR
ncbi:uncharacterized protein LOC144149520 [Haemaphysalis longicornis]